MKKIALTQGGFALVDNEDFKRLQGFMWTLAAKKTGHVYAMCKVKKDGKRITLQMHRVILNAPKGVYVDHVNGYGLDNRKSNIRLCIQSQNQANRGAPQQSISGVKGVRFHHPNGKTFLSRPWEARITRYGKTISLGHYATKEEAAHAYNKKAKELFGDFARLNEI